MRRLCLMLFFAVLFSAGCSEQSRTDHPRPMQTLGEEKGTAVAYPVSNVMFHGKTTAQAWAQVYEFIDAADGHTYRFICSWDKELGDRAPRASGLMHSPECPKCKTRH